MRIWHIFERIGRRPLLCPRPTNILTNSRIHSSVAKRYYCLSRSSGVYAAVRLLCSRFKENKTLCTITFDVLIFFFLPNRNTGREIRRACAFGAQVATIIYSYVCAQRDTCTSCVLRQSIYLTFFVVFSRTNLLACIIHIILYKAFATLRPLFTKT